MANKKIVLVEDDASLAEIYRLKFEQEGYDIKTASDGEAGLALIQQELPSVVLLDIMMPKMDGFAVLAEIKKGDKTKSIPVIMLSNLGQKSDLEKGKQMGATDYVVKASLTPAELYDKTVSLIK